MSGPLTTYGSDSQTPSVLGTTAQLPFAHTDPQLPPTFWYFPTATAPVTDSTTMIVTAPYSSRYRQSPNSSKGARMRIYPSCLFNRITEARRHFPSVERTDWKSVVYPYSLIDLAVRMRPIVDVVNSAKGIDPKVELLCFEPSWWFDGNKKYIGAQSVSIVVLLGAIIHETYVHIGATQDAGSRRRLDVKSDRGRWIVYFDDFIDIMRTY